MPVATSRSTVAALAIFGALMVAATVLAMNPVAQRWSGDVPLLGEEARLMLTGRHDQSQFLSWYPPLALVPLGAPLLAGSGPTYAFVMAAEMAAIAAIAAYGIAGVGRTLGSAFRALLVYGALVLATAALVVWRYDIVPAVLVLGAIWGATMQRWTAAGITLALAAGLKVFAVILAPLFAAYAWRTGGPSRVARFLAAATVPGIVSLGAYLLFPGATPLDLLAFTAERPLHIETVAGSVIAFLDLLGIGAAEVAFGSFSYNLVGEMASAAPGLLRLLQLPVVGGTILLGSIAIWRSGLPREPTLLVATVSAVLALLVTNPVLSAQYIIWVLPLAPLMPGRVRWPLVGVIALTALLFPWLYSGLVELEPLPVVVLVARNCLLVAAWVAAVARLVMIASAPNGRFADERQREEDGRPVVDPEVRDGGHPRQDRRADRGRPAQREGEDDDAREQSQAAGPYLP
jgi:hypothetical protein